MLMMEKIEGEREKEEKKRENGRQRKGEQEKKKKKQNEREWEKYDDVDQERSSNLQLLLPFRLVAVDASLVA